MQQITPQQFIDRVEAASIKDVWVVGKRVYGTDYSVRPPGKFCTVFYCDIP